MASIGFHYYKINVDGAQVPDPGSLFFYGASRWGSGGEVPANYLHGDSPVRYRERSSAPRATFQEPGDRVVSFPRFRHLGVVPEHVRTSAICPAAEPLPCSPKPSGRATAGPLDRSFSPKFQSEDRPIAASAVARYPTDSSKIPARANPPVGRNGTGRHAS